MHSYVVGNFASVLKPESVNVSTRSVKLDDEAEAALWDIVSRTGMSISDALKQGLLAYRNVLLDNPTRPPAAFFREFDLGEGGYTAGPARQAKDLVKQRLRGRGRRS